LSEFFVFLLDMPHENEFLVLHHSLEHVLPVFHSPGHSFFRFALLVLALEVFHWVGLAHDDADQTLNVVGLFAAALRQRGALARSEELRSVVLAVFWAQLGNFESVQLRLQEILAYEFLNAYGPLSLWNCVNRGDQTLLHVLELLNLLLLDFRQLLTLGLAFLVKRDLFVGLSLVGLLHWRRWGLLGWIVQVQLDFDGVYLRVSFTFHIFGLVYGCLRLLLLFFLNFFGLNFLLFFLFLFFVLNLNLFNDLFL